MKLIFQNYFKAKQSTSIQFVAGMLEYLLFEKVNSIKGKNIHVDSGTI